MRFEKSLFLLKRCLMKLFSNLMMNGNKFLYRIFTLQKFWNQFLLLVSWIFILLVQVVCSQNLLCRTKIFNKNPTNIYRQIFLLICNLNKQHFPFLTYSCDLFSRVNCIIMSSRIIKCIHYLRTSSLILKSSTQKSIKVYYKTESTHVTSFGSQ